MYILAKYVYNRHFARTHVFFGMIHFLGLTIPTVPRHFSADLQEGCDAKTRSGSTLDKKRSRWKSRHDLGGKPWI
jgi:hypothetical protein